MSKYVFSTEPEFVSNKAKSLIFLFFGHGKLVGFFQTLPTLSLRKLEDLKLFIICIFRSNFFFYEIWQQKLFFQKEHPCPTKGLMFVPLRIYIIQNYPP